MEIRYYFEAIKRERNNPKSEQLYADQQKLLGKLQQQNIAIILGQVIRHPDKTYHEKGVDVRLAVEMIRFAREDKYDIAYLVSFSGGGRRSEGFSQNCSICRHS